MCNVGSCTQHISSCVVCASNYARSGAYCAEVRTVSSGALRDDSPTLTLRCNANFSIYILCLHGYPDSSSLTLSFLAGFPKLKAVFAAGSSHSQSRGICFSGRWLCSSVGWIIAGRLLPPRCSIDWGRRLRQGWQACGVHAPTSPPCHCRWAERRPCNVWKTYWRSSGVTRLLV